MWKPKIPLPVPELSSGPSVWDVMRVRRSVREFADDPILITELSLILWAAQGVTDAEDGLRTVPSAGATYPLKIYVAVKEGGVVGPGIDAKPSLRTGLYEYLPEHHALWLLKPMDVRPYLARASFGQGFIAEAPVSVVVSAQPDRTTFRYGKRGYRYVYMEVGHAGQNIYLAATALGLGTVAVGAFNDSEVKKILGVKMDENPMYIMPIGRPRE